MDTDSLESDPLHLASGSNTSGRTRQIENRASLGRCQHSSAYAFCLIVFLAIAGTLCCLCALQLIRYGPCSWQVNKGYSLRCHQEQCEASCDDVSPFFDLLDQGSASPRADISREAIRDEEGGVNRLWNVDSWQGLAWSGHVRREGTLEPTRAGWLRSFQDAAANGVRKLAAPVFSALGYSRNTGAVGQLLGDVRHSRDLNWAKATKEKLVLRSNGFVLRHQPTEAPQTSAESIMHQWSSRDKIELQKEVGSEQEAALESAGAGTGEGGIQRRAGQRQLLEAESIPKHRALHRSRKMDDTCWARSERHLYHLGSSAMPSQAWSRQLTRYAVMHRRCTAPITDWVAFYKNPFQGDGVEEGADVSGCKYLLWVSPGYAGLGNRLASLTSTFLYAVLTNRALVLTNHSNVGRLLCNPMPESTWLIEEPSYLWIRRNAYQWYPRVQLYHTLLENGTQDYSKTVFINLKYNCEEEDWTFFCEKEQKSLLKAPWALLLTDEYMVPGLALVPRFRREMERLFPDGLVFTHLARYLLHPNNYLWDRITRTWHAYLAHHDVKVGIQVRTFHSHDRDTDPRVLECAMNVSKYLPQAESQEDWMARLENAETDRSVKPLVTNPTPKRVGVFITSLQLHHYEYVKKVYTEGQTKDGSIVTLHFQSSDGAEQRNKHDQYERALVEIWLLSFSDKLITSEFSSFGYIAAGLAGIVPYEMNIAERPDYETYKNSTRPVCALGAIEPCFLVPPLYLPCNNQQVEPNNVHKSVKTCPNIEKGISLQMKKSWGAHWR